MLTLFHIHFIIMVDCSTDMSSLLLEAYWGWGGGSVGLSCENEVNILKFAVNSCPSFHSRFELYRPSNFEEIFNESDVQTARKYMVTGMVTGIPRHATVSTRDVGRS